MVICGFGVNNILCYLFCMFTMMHIRFLRKGVDDTVKNIKIILVIAGIKNILQELLIVKRIKQIHY